MNDDLAIARMMKTAVVICSLFLTAVGYAIFTLLGH